MTKEKLTRLLELTFRDGIRVGTTGGSDEEITSELEALEAEFESWEPRESTPTVWVTGCPFCGRWGPEKGCADCLLQQRDEARRTALLLAIEAADCIVNLAPFRGFRWHNHEIEKALEWRHQFNPPDLPPTGRAVEEG